MPEPGQPVVVNATPIITLAAIHQIDLLRDLYGEVFIPGAVHAELAAGSSQRTGFEELGSRPWIRVVDLQDPTRAELLADLDRGEAEVIALALETHARLVILDERLARRHALRLGLPVTGTVGVLLKAKAHGLILRVGPFLEAAQRHGIWLSRDLVEEALRLAGE